MAEKKKKQSSKAKKKKQETLKPTRIQTAEHAKRELKEILEERKREES